MHPTLKSIQSVTHIRLSGISSSSISSQYDSVSYYYYLISYGLYLIWTLYLIWSHFISLGLNFSDFVSSNLIWSHLISYGLCISSGLGPFGLISSHQDWSFSFCPQLFSVRLILSHFVSTATLIIWFDLISSILVSCQIIWSCLISFGFISSPNSFSLILSYSI